MVVCNKCYGFDVRRRERDWTDIRVNSLQGQGPANAVFQRVRQFSRENCSRMLRSGMRMTFRSSLMAPALTRFFRLLEIWTRTVPIMDASSSSEWRLRCSRISVPIRIPSVRARSHRNFARRDVTVFSERASARSTKLFI